MKSVLEFRTYNTLIDLEESTRRSLITLLNQRLADMVDLFNQTKYAHWNVKGSDFIQLHELFDNVAERVEEACDLLAERVATLGGTAAGTTRQSANVSSIPEYDLSAVDGPEHVASLAGQIAHLAASVRSAIKESDRLGDPTTADLFTEISRTLDKDLWFLEAHLQAKKV
ncbi:MAG TPA: DNA starvation/stationary phase protection protein Dps [Blastocatellia bacterium]|nr:DNA starvation/stationary phase protection protein Dps [Blastocatellia bacterium]